jgi:hypothetical protein
MLSRICLLTGVCVLLAFPFVGAADETKAPDDLPEVTVRLQLIAIESAKLATHYGILVERELNLQGSVRAAIKSGDQRLPEFQQGLQEAQGDLETTRKKMIALESERLTLRKRLGEKNSGNTAIDQTENMSRKLDKILERLDRIEKRLEKMEKRRP